MNIEWLNVAQFIFGWAIGMTLCYIAKKAWKENSKVTLYVLAQFVAILIVCVLLGYIKF